MKRMRWLGLSAAVLVAGLAAAAASGGLTSRSAADKNPGPEVFRS